MKIADFTILPRMVYRKQFISTFMEAGTFCVPFLVVCVSIKCITLTGKYRMRMFFGASNLYQYALAVYLWYYKD